MYNNSSKLGAECELISIQGSHGTTTTRALNIRSSGFNKSVDNFWGDGVYFFKRYPRGTEFALKWYKYSFSKGWYENDDDDSCTVVHANIETSKECFLDCNDKKIQVMYHELESMLAGREYTISQKNHIRNKWLLNTERILNNEIKVFVATIPLVKKFFKPTKSAECIVVRDTCCILEPYSLEKIHG